MKNKALLFFTLLCFIFAATKAGGNNDKDCEKFKKGTFLLVGSPYKIIRSDTTQTEINTITEGYTVLKIKWVSPCQYQLVFLRQHKQTGEDYTPPVIQKMTLTCSIMRTHGDSCFILSAMVSNDFHPQSSILVLQHDK
jgi:hypothetical protein